MISASSILAELKIVSRYGGEGSSHPQNLAWIHAPVSEKPEFTDGQTTDACAMTVALLSKSSRAKNPKRSFVRTIEEKIQRKSLKASNYDL